jgi:hypothetical protein
MAAGTITHFIKVLTKSYDDGVSLLHLSTNHDQQQQQANSW